jgi:hypothetical protein
MPWHISNNKEGCSGFAVVKDSDGSIAGCHETKEKAQKQLAALYASETRKNIDPGSIWDGVFFPND